MALHIVGSAGLTFPQVGNKEVLGILGDPRMPEWLEQKTGIRGHSLNVDPRTFIKRANVTAVDYAEQVAKDSLVDAGLDSSRIHQLVLCTCTPAQQLFWADAIELHRRLNLKRDARILEVPGGCAALAQAFYQVELESFQADRQGREWNALIIAVNDTASYFDQERYRRVRGAWLSFSMFADGAAALALSTSGDGPRLAGTYCAYDGAHPLVTYRGGGGLVPTSAATLDEHLFLMNPQDIAAQFAPTMQRVWEHFHAAFCLELSDVRRFYIHQANVRLIEELTERFGIPRDAVPINADRFGNTVSASTLLLLDEDRKRFGETLPTPFLFMWVGAGMVEGGALFL